MSPGEGSETPIRDKLEIQKNDGHSPCSLFEIQFSCARDFEKEHEAVQNPIKNIVKKLKHETM